MPSICACMALTRAHALFLTLSACQHAQSTQCANTCCLPDRSAKLKRKSRCRWIISGNKRCSSQLPKRRLVLPDGVACRHATAPLPAVSSSLRLSLSCLCCFVCLFSVCANVVCACLAVCGLSMQHSQTLSKVYLGSLLAPHAPKSSVAYDMHAIQVLCPTFSRCQHVNHEQMTP